MPWKRITKSVSIRGEREGEEGGIELHFEIAGVDKQKGCIFAGM